MFSSRQTSVFLFCLFALVLAVVATVVSSQPAPPGALPTGGTTFRIDCASQPGGVVDVDGLSNTNNAIPLLPQTRLQIDNVSSAVGCNGVSIRNTGLINQIVFNAQTGEQVHNVSIFISNVTCRVLENANYVGGMTRACVHFFKEVINTDMSKHIVIEDVRFLRPDAQFWWFNPQWDTPQDIKRRQMYAVYHEKTVIPGSHYSVTRCGTAPENDGGSSDINNNAPMVFEYPLVQPNFTLVVGALMLPGTLRVGPAPSNSSSSPSPLTGVNISDNFVRVSITGDPALAATNLSTITSLLVMTVNFQHSVQVLGSAENGGDVMTVSNNVVACDILDNTAPQKDFGVKVLQHEQSNLAVPESFEAGSIVVTNNSVLVGRSRSNTAFSMFILRITAAAVTLHRNLSFSNNTLSTGAFVHFRAPSASVPSATLVLAGCMVGECVWSVASSLEFVGNRLLTPPAVVAATGAVPHRGTTDMVYAIARFFTIRLEKSPPSSPPLLLLFSRNQLRIHRDVSTQSQIYIASFSLPRIDTAVSIVAADNILFAAARAHLFVLLALTNTTLGGATTLSVSRNVAELGQPRAGNEVEQVNDVLGAGSPRVNIVGIETSYGSETLDDEDQRKVIGSMDFSSNTVLVDDDVVCESIRTNIFALSRPLRIASASFSDNVVSTTRSGQRDTLVTLTGSDTTQVNVFSTSSALSITSDFVFARNLVNFTAHHELQVPSPPTGLISVSASCARWASRADITGGVLNFTDNAVLADITGNWTEPQSSLNAYALVAFFAQPLVFSRGRGFAIVFRSNSVSLNASAPNEIPGASPFASILYANEGFSASNSAAPLDLALFENNTVNAQFSSTGALVFFVFVGQVANVSDITIRNNSISANQTGGNATYSWIQCSLFQVSAATSSDYTMLNVHSVRLTHNTVVVQVHGQGTLRIFENSRGLLARPIVDLNDGGNDGCGDITISSNLLSLRTAHNLAGYVSLLSSRVLQISGSLIVDNNTVREFHESLFGVEGRQQASMIQAVADATVAMRRLLLLRNDIEVVYDSRRIPPSYALRLSIGFFSIEGADVQEFLFVDNSLRFIVHTLGSTTSVSIRGIELTRLWLRGASSNRFVVEGNSMFVDFARLLNTNDHHSAMLLLGPMSVFGAASAVAAEAAAAASSPAAASTISSFVSIVDNHITVTTDNVTHEVNCHLLSADLPVTAPTEIWVNLTAVHLSNNSLVGQMDCALPVLRIVSFQRVYLMTILRGITFENNFGKLTGAAASDHLGFGTPVCGVFCIALSHATVSDVSLLLVSNNSALVSSYRAVTTVGTKLRAEVFFFSTSSDFNAVPALKGGMSVPRAPPRLVIADNIAEIRDTFLAATFSGFVSLMICWLPRLRGVAVEILRCHARISFNSTVYGIGHNAHILMSVTENAAASFEMRDCSIVAHNILAPDSRNLLVSLFTDSPNRAASRGANVTNCTIDCDKVEIRTAILRVYAGEYRTNRDELGADSVIRIADCAIRTRRLSTSLDGWGGNNQFIIANGFFDANKRVDLLVLRCAIDAEVAIPDCEESWLYSAVNIVSVYGLSGAALPSRPAAEVVANMSSISIIDSSSRLSVSPLHPLLEFLGGQLFYFSTLHTLLLFPVSIRLRGVSAAVSLPDRALGTNGSFPARFSFCNISILGASDDIVVEDSNFTVSVVETAVSSEFYAQSQPLRLLPEGRVVGASLRMVERTMTGIDRGDFGPSNVSVRNLVVTVEQQQRAGTSSLCVGNVSGIDGTCSIVIFDHAGRGYSTWIPRQRVVPGNFVFVGNTFNATSDTAASVDSLSIVRFNAPVTLTDLSNVNITINSNTLAAQMMSIKLPPQRPELVISGSVWNSSRSRFILDGSATLRLGCNRFFFSSAADDDVSRAQWATTARRANKWLARNVDSNSDSAGKNAAALGIVADDGCLSWTFTRSVTRRLTATGRSPSASLSLSAATASIVPTTTRSPQPTETRSPTATHEATETSTVTVSRTPPPTSTRRPSPSESQRPSLSSSPSATIAATSSPTFVLTKSDSATNTDAATATLTRFASSSASPTASIGPPSFSRSAPTHSASSSIQPPMRPRGFFSLSPLALGATTAISILSSNPASAVFLQRIKSMMLMAQCGAATTTAEDGSGSDDAADHGVAVRPDELPPLAFDSSPTAMTIGETHSPMAPLRPWRGALVGNSVIAVGILLLQAAAAFATTHAKPLRYPTLWSALQKLHFPGLVVIPLIVFVTPTMMILAAVAGLQRPPAILEIAAAAIVYCAVPIPVQLWLVKRVHRTEDLVEVRRNDDEKKKTKKQETFSQPLTELWSWLIVQDREWKDKSKNKKKTAKKKTRSNGDEVDDNKQHHQQPQQMNLAASWGDVYEPYAVTYWAVLDYVVAAIVGLCGGISLASTSQSTCVTSAIISLVFVTLRLVAIFVVKPFLCRLDLGFGVGAALVETVTALVVTLTLLAPDGFSAGDSMNSVGMASAMMALLAGATALTPKLARLFKAVRKSLGRVSKIFGSSSGKKKRKTTKNKKFDNNDSNLQSMLRGGDDEEDGANKNNNNNLSHFFSHSPRKNDGDDDDDEIALVPKRRPASPPAAAAPTSPRRVVKTVSTKVLSRERVKRTSALSVGAAAPAASSGKVNLELI